MLMTGYDALLSKISIESNFGRFLLYQVQASVNAAESCQRDHNISRFHHVVRSWIRSQRSSASGTSATSTSSTSSPQEDQVTIRSIWFKLNTI